jgi:sirohydrochlorin cobaltochelatase
MLLENGEELRAALDQFYPASVGIYLAHRQGTLELENLRDKLDRQTGMYRFARKISDAAAQRLVREVCGPAHQCARRILWQLDADTPLEDSEASRFNGIVGGTPESRAIPLLCREACNHFVSQCRLVAKEESSQTQP